MANKVYDDQDYDDPLRHIDPREEAEMERRASEGLDSGGDGGYSNQIAKQVRGAENAAAAGKGPSRQQAQGVNKTSGNGASGSISRGGSGASASGAAEGKSRDDLKAKESSGLYKPDSSQSVGQRIGRQFNVRKNMALLGFLTFFVGGGAGFAVFGQISGPLQFLHASELLKGFHWAVQEDQGTSRVLKAMRNIRYAVRGEYERSRMGYLGNYMADRVERKMNARGYSTEFDGAGNFTGYRIDPARINFDDHPNLIDRDPESVRAYFADRYGVDVEIIDGEIRIPPTNNYRRDRGVLLAILKDSGYKMVSPLSGRTLGVRANAGWHWLKVLTGDTIDAKYRAWVKRQFDAIRGNASPPRVTPGDANEDEEVPEGNEDTDAVREIQDQADGVAEDLADGDTSSQEELKSSIRSRFGVGGAGAAGLIGVLCAIANFADRIDEINQTNVILPMIRMAIQTISMGDQVKNGRDVDPVQLGFMSELLYDKKTKTSWIDARSIKAEQGKPLSGPDIPSDAKVDPEGNMVTKIVNNIPGLATTCRVLEGPAGFVILGALAIVAPVKTIVELVIGGIFSATLGEVLVDYFANLFAATTVSPLAAGAVRGNFMNYGSKLAGNDQAMSRGGLPLTANDSRALGALSDEIRQEEFNEKSLSYRLFNANDPKSLFAQIIDKQAPTAGDNVSRTAMAFLDAGKSFSATLSSIFSKSVGAEPVTPYDYGFPDYAYSLSEINDPNLENPFANAEETVAILDANLEANAPLVNPVTTLPNTDNYVVRAKECFGVDIRKQTVTINEEEVEQYTVAAPTTGQIPTQSDVINPDNKCLEGHDYAYSDGTSGLDNVATTVTTDDGRKITMRNVQGATADWTRVRMFIFDTQMVNSIACYEFEEGDPEGDKACQDMGMTGGGGGGGPGAISRNGTQLIKNGQPWKFIGINADGFGLNDCRRGTEGANMTDENIDRFFRELSPNSVTRIWPYDGADNIPLMDKLVTAAEKYNQYLAPAFFDGNDQQCGSQAFGDVAANLEHIRPIIERYAKGTGTRATDVIAFWETSNEIGCDDAPGWHQGLAAGIKQIDPATLVGTGTAPYSSSAQEVADCHADPAIDLISIHEYDNGCDVSHQADKAIEASRMINKPWYSGESGGTFDGDGDYNGKAGAGECLKREWQAYLDAENSAGMLYWDYKMDTPGSLGVGADTATFLPEANELWTAAMTFRHQYNQ